MLVMENGEENKQDLVDNQVSASDNSQLNQDQNNLPVYTPDSTYSNTEDSPQNSADIKPEGQSFSWIGPEFISFDKSSTWYLAFVTTSILLGALIYFLTKDVISAATVVIAIAIVGGYSLRKPKNISYLVSESGVVIGNKSYSFEEFRSFTLNEEGKYLNITFLPLKRFATASGIFYEGQEADNLINFLSDRLPQEQHKPDLLDIFMQRIKF